MFLQSDVAEGSGGLSRDSKTIKYPVVGSALALAEFHADFHKYSNHGQRERRPYNRVNSGIVSPV